MTSHTADALRGDHPRCEVVSFPAGVLVVHTDDIDTIVLNATSEAR